MEDIRLYLDDKLVDIDTSTKIVETKQINSLFDLQDRQASFTKNFNVLLTKDTLSVLDNVGKPYNRSDKPYNKIKAQVYRGATATVGDGYFQIKEVRNLKGRESAVLKGNVMSDTIGLFEAIGSKMVSSLSGLSGLRHPFSDDIVTKTKDHKWTDGYIYLRGNYGYYDNGHKEAIYTPPCLFLKWLWHEIFNEAEFEYKYVGAVDFFNTDEVFDKAVITVERLPIDFNIKEGQELNKNIFVEFPNLIESISQKDIIKEVCNMFGLIFKRDKVKKVYYFIKIEELLKDFKGAVDYSDKLFGTNSIKFSFGSYGQRNHFQWEYDKGDDNVKQGVNDGSFDIPNMFLPKYKITVKSKFKSFTGEAMQFLEFNGEYQKEKNGNKEENKRDSDGRLIPILKNLKTKPYILMSSNNASAFFVFGALKWDFLIGKYYNTLENVLKHQEVREVEMELTAQDVRDFDFFKLVYLKQYQAYYYCNKISNYTGGKVTKVELVRVSSLKLRDKN